MPGLAERALRIIRERYADFGPTLACEKLAEIHDLYLAKETVRKLMTRDGLWIPRKLRPPRVHQPRPRRACTGELIQIDGSEHRWFEDRGPACTLLVYVDDATSRLMQLLFVSSGPRSPILKPPGDIWSATVSLWHSTATKPASSGSTTSRPPAEMARLSLVVP
jgi:hypothetical protein